MLEVDWKALKKIVGKNLTLDDLEKVLFGLGMELEGESEGNLSISITPDRPDLVSLHGLCRAIKAYQGIKAGMPSYKTIRGSYRILILPAVKDVRPYTVAAVVRDLTFDDDAIKEMIWVQEKLHDTLARGRKKGAIGIYPLEKIAWPITYTALDPAKIRFQPLESATAMTGKKILESHPAGRAYRHLLEGKKAYPIFRDAKGDILSMPPIINSHTTGKVTHKTKDIFIECSGSNFSSLHTLLKILVTMFADMGGKVYEVELAYQDKIIRTPDLKPEERTIKLADITKILGQEFSQAQAGKLLERMLYDVAKKGKDALFVKIPSFRSDIWHDVDIIDDIARAYGLNNFATRMQPVPTIGKELPGQELKRKIETILIGAGITQAFTLALTSTEDQFTKMNISEEKHIALGTAAEKSLNMVRVALLPELLKALTSNRNREYPQRLFEIEDVILPDPTADVRAMNVKRLALITAHPEASFTEAKQLLTYLCDCLNQSCELREENDARFIEGRSAALIIKGRKAGVIGEISPVVLTRWGIEMPAAGFEIDINPFSP